MNFYIGLCMFCCVASGMCAAFSFVEWAQRITDWRPFAAVSVVLFIIAVASISLSIYR